MTNDSFLGGVLLISGIAGFIFWPAWIITGIVILIQSSETSSVSHVPKNNNLVRPLPHRVPDISILDYEFGGAQEANISSRKQSDLPRLAQIANDDSVSKTILWPEVQGAQKALTADRCSTLVMPKADPILKGTPPLGNLTEGRIADMVRKRKIKQLVHFTRCENVGPILERGLLSVTDLEMERVEAIRNDTSRLDNKPDAVCLSVSFPNHRMFYKYRCEGQDAEWAVLRLKPAILWELDCLFYEMNAADHRMRHRSRSEAQGPNSFAAIFGSLGGARPFNLDPSYPTNVQAEVLVTELIDPSYIVSVAFETQESHRRWAHLTGDVSVTIEGRGAGLFGSRERILAN